MNCGIRSALMNRSEDLKLADDLQREIDDCVQPGAGAASVAEQQDWINTARLAVRSLRSGAATDEQQTRLGPR
jgi:hypothetical protein